MKICSNLHWRMKMWRTQFSSMLKNEDEFLPHLLKMKNAFWKKLKTEDLKSSVKYVKKMKTTLCAGSPYHICMLTKNPSRQAWNFLTTVSHSYVFPEYSLQQYILYSWLCTLRGNSRASHQNSIPPRGISLDGIIRYPFSCCGGAKAGKA